MKDDFGYFGSGLEGYVQYNEAFKRNFDNTPDSENSPDIDVSDAASEDDDLSEDDSNIDLENEGLRNSDDF